MRSQLSRLFRDDSGATAIEYGLVVSLVAIGALFSFSNFGNATQRMWNNVSTDVEESVTFP